jgi:hypothetical protein
MLWTRPFGHAGPVGTGQVSPDSAHSGHGSAMRLRTVVPVVHTAYDYDERI